MKKLLFILVASLAFLTACEEDELVKQPAEGDAPTIIYATIDDELIKESQTRTYIDNINVLWHNGDAISLFTNTAHNVKYIYKGESGASDAAFEKVNNTGTTGKATAFSHAVYPYNESYTSTAHADGRRLTVTYPATQTYAPNSFGPGANLMVTKNCNG